MRKKLALSISLVGVAMVVGAGAPPAQARAACSFRFVDSPALDLGGRLLGAAGSPADAWAVGANDDGAALRAHRNGRGWAIVPGPNPGVENILEDVAVISSRDVWAVGASFDGTQDRRLIQHWNGTRWTTFPQPPSPGLLGVTAFATDDVWAVGEILGVMRWDGTTWSNVPHPPLEEADLHAAAGAAPDDLWIVGAQETEGAGDHAFAMHWDGTVLSVAPLPSTGADESELLDVAVVGPSDVWAVGEMDFGEVKRTLVEHWDGQAWAIVDSPNPGADLDELTGVGAISAADVWAAGTWGEGGVEHPMVVHWDGNSWTSIRAQLPDPSDTVVTLEGLTVLSPSRLLAVGAHGPSDVDLQPLVEASRSCG
jgi:hypothetical protein